jgi:hypothetical protein
MKPTFDPPLGDTEDALESSVILPKSQGESAATSVTGGCDSYSEEETGWLGGIGADFRTLAITLRETAGGVVSFVHRSAINVAHEIALLEEVDDLVADESNLEAEPLHLPWEIENEEGVYKEDEYLKKRIMDLSERESTFMEPFSSHATEEEDNDDFVLDDARVHIIRQLLKIDHQLSSTHARLSGRSDVRESTFWRNYFHACGETRKEFVKELDRTLEVSSQRSPNSLVVDDDDCSVGNEGFKSDDESFVCLSAGKIPSPPGSGKSAGVKSVDSMVMVEAISSQSLLDYI